MTPPLRSSVGGGAFAVCESLHAQLSHAHRKHPFTSLLHGVYSAGADDALSLHIAAAVQARCSPTDATPAPAIAPGTSRGRDAADTATGPAEMSFAQMTHKATDIPPQSQSGAAVFCSDSGEAAAFDPPSQQLEPHCPPSAPDAPNARALRKIHEAWNPEEVSPEAQAQLQLQLQQLVAGGIPASYRRHVWFALSGGASRQAAFPVGHYHRLTCHAMPEDSVLRLVEKDVLRTFPGHEQLQRPKELQKLERVLCALACNNPHIGYTQGMNRLAAFALLVLPEEEAFWVTDVLVNEILPPQLLSDSLQDAHAAAYTMECLLGSGSLVRHLRSMDLPLSMVFTEWFMCLGTSLWPSEVVFRIWDAVFLHGFGVMFDVCLHMLRRAAPRIAALAGKPRQLYELVAALPKEWAPPQDALGLLGDKRSVAAAGVAFMAIARKEVARMSAGGGSDTDG